jgi:hypothetical protein
LFIC